MMVPDEHGGAGLDASYDAGDGENQRRVRVVRRHHERQQLALLRPSLAFGNDEQKRVPRALRRWKEARLFQLTEPMSGRMPKR